MYFDSYNFKPRRFFRKRAWVRSYSIIRFCMTIDIFVGWFSSTDYKVVFLGCQCTVLSRALTLESSVASIHALNQCLSNLTTGFATSLTWIINVVLLLQKDTILVYWFSTSPLSSLLQVCTARGSSYGCWWATCTFRVNTRMQSTLTIYHIDYTHVL